MIEIEDKRREFFISVGALIVIAGLVAIGFSIEIAISILIFSVGFFFGKRGVDVDPENNRYRSFLLIWFFKLGRWKSIQPNDSLNLSLSARNDHMNMGGVENQLIASSKTILYILSIQRGMEKVRIFKFKSYKCGRKAMDAMSESFGLQYLDEIMQKMEENRMKRRR